MTERTFHPTARAAAVAQARELRALHMARLAAALIASALLLLAPRIAHGQDWRTVSQSRQTAGESALRVDVEYGAGSLKLSSAPRGTLYTTQMRYDADAFTPRVAYAGGRLRVGFENTRVRGGRNTRGANLDVKLSQDVPIDLELKFGAAEAVLDLGGLSLRRAEIQTGASSTKLDVATPNSITCDLFEVQVGAAKFEALRLGNLNARRIRVQGGVGEVMLDFSGGSAAETTAGIEMGLGQLTLSLPRGLGVRVHKRGLLASFDSQGLIKRGDAFYSENWENAERKLTIDLDAALGTIKVVWVDS